MRLVLQVLKDSPLPVPTLRAMGKHDAVFVLGEDLTQTAARLALSLRQSVKGSDPAMAAAQKIQPWLNAAVQNIGQSERNPLFIASVAATPPGRRRRRPVCMARRWNWPVSAMPWPMPSTPAPGVDGLSDEVAEQARLLAETLLAAERPTGGIRYLPG